MSDEQEGRSISLHVTTPAPVAKRVLPVGISPELWPSGQGAVMFNENKLDAKPLKERE